jgi:hypothetical protein
MSTNKKHFLARVHASAEVGAQCDWEVDRSHPLKPLLQRLPQWFYYSGECKELASISLKLKADEDSVSTGKKEVNKEESKSFLGSLSAPNTEKILEFCNPSAFGKGSKTVYDESVRKGKEIKAELLDFGSYVAVKRVWRSGNYVDDTVISPMIDVIRDKIIKKLPSDFLGVYSSEVDVQFYKLAVYESGGHFQKHRDTVHSANHRATLLIEIKNDHEGGTLLIEKNDIKREWKLAKNKEYDEEATIPDDLLFTLSSDEDDSTGKGGNQKSAGVSAGKGSKKLKTNSSFYDNENNEQEQETPAIKWCIFYTDVEHQVEPVMKGVRMVLQFDVYCKGDTKSSATEEFEEEEENDDDDEFDEADAYAQDCLNEEEEQFEDIFKLSASQCLNTLDVNATAVMKKSVIKSIATCLTKKLAKDNSIAIPLYYLYTLQSIDYDSLKNLDRELFDCLLNEGFRVGLSPIELIAETAVCDGSFNGEGSGYKLNLHDFPIKVYQKQPVLTKGSHKRSNEGNDEISFQLMPKWPKTLSLTYVHSGMESSLLCESKSYSEYTGNEAEQGLNRYLCGTMIIFKKKNNHK